MSKSFWPQPRFSQNGGKAEPDKVRVALVGLGRMGNNHLRVMTENPNYEIVGVADSIAQVEGYLCKSRWQDLPTFDAAVVATPTSTHFELASELLRANKDVLVEKPIASDGVSAAALTTLAKQSGRKLVVGHVERFNPAVRKLQEVIAAGWLGTPIHFSFTRVGGFPNTLMKGNNVVLDLAVHDIDVFRSIAGELHLVSSVTHSTWKKGLVDTAELLLRAESGMTANVHVNWVTPTKIRQIRVTGTAGVCFVDYMLQTCELMGGNLLKQGEGPEYADFEQLTRLYHTTDRISFGVDKVEPLKIEHEQFVRYLRTGEPGGLCTAEEGASAVRIAEGV